METRSIPGFEGVYSVTCDGRVWSHPRLVKRKRGVYTRQGRWLRWHVPANRYPQVKFYDGIPRSVHQLVMAAWGSPRPSPRHEVNHKDCDKLNNSIDNLEWVTPLENTHHAIANGHEPQRPTKLTKDQVVAIRARYTGRRGERAALAREFGVSQASYITAILNNKVWKGV